MIVGTLIVSGVFLWAMSGLVYWFTGGDRESRTIQSRIAELEADRLEPYGDLWHDTLQSELRHLDAHQIHLMHIQWMDAHGTGIGPLPDARTRKRWEPWQYALYICARKVTRS